MKKKFTTGNWIVIISGAMFIVSLFLPWTNTGGFVNGGISLMKIRISRVSGMPMLYIISLFTTISCMLLCFLFLKKHNTSKYKNISISQIILSILGIMIFALFPFEFSTWRPYVIKLFGFWLAIVSLLGVFIGVIVNFVKIGQLKRN
jgi:hypothetical protein